MPRSLEIRWIQLRWVLVRVLPLDEAKGCVMLRRYLPVLLLLCALQSVAEDVTRPESGQGSISGTVLDVNDGIVPGASVVLRCQHPCEGQSTTANDAGAFEFHSLDFGVPYEIGISASGFRDWKSELRFALPAWKHVCTFWGSGGT